MGCRNCLFVKIDIPSGGDIDGCLKEDVIEEFKADLQKPAILRTHFQNISAEKALIYLNWEETHLDEEHCTEKDTKRPEPTTPEEIKADSQQFFKNRELSYRSYKQHVYDRILATEKYPLSKLRELYPAKDKPSTMTTGHTEPLTAFTEDK